jgi:hypothetical protein
LQERSSRNTCWLKPGNKVPERAIKGLQDEINELSASSVAQTNKNGNHKEMIACSLDVDCDTKEFA